MNDVNGNIKEYIDVPKEKGTAIIDELKRIMMLFLVATHVQLLKQTPVKSII